MREHIQGTWTRVRLDSYLRRTYGHALIKFEISYLNTCYIGKFPSLLAGTRRSIPKQEKRLEKLQICLIELFDSYLREIDFYKSVADWGSIAVSGYLPWTTKNRTAFIKRCFRLEPTLSMLDTITRWISMPVGKAEIIPFTRNLAKKIRIDPINLLVLVWSTALKRKSKISWKDMYGLLDWLSRNNTSPAFKNFFRESPRGGSRENALKQGWARYRLSDYQDVAKNQYEAIFQLLDEESLIDYKDHLVRSIANDRFKSRAEVANMRLAMVLMTAHMPELYGTIDDILVDEDMLLDETED